MPLNREQIKRAPVSQEIWRPQRTQVGGLWFDPREIRPLGDHVLIELELELMQVNYVTRIILPPDICTNTERQTRAGIVLRVGPGNWNEKKWRRDPMTLKPGDAVIIGPYSDWESWASDYEGRDNNIVLCQEADVRLYCNGHPN